MSIIQKPDLKNIMAQSRHHKGVGRRDLLD